MPKTVPFEHVPLSPALPEVFHQRLADPIFVFKTTDEATNLGDTWVGAKELN